MRNEAASYPISLYHRRSVDDVFLVGAPEGRDVGFNVVLDDDGVPRRFARGLLGKK